LIDFIALKSKVGFAEITDSTLVNAKHFDEIKALHFLQSNSITKE